MRTPVHLQWPTRPALPRAGSLTASALGKGGTEWHGGEGPGWSLGCDRSAEARAFGGLVGGQGWMAAVMRGEYDDFVRVRARQGVCWVLDSRHARRVRYFVKRASARECGLGTVFVVARVRATPPACERAVDLSRARLKCSLAASAWCLAWHCQLS